MTVRNGVVRAGTDSDAIVRGHVSGSGCRRIDARPSVVDRARAALAGRSRTRHGLQASEPAPVPSTATSRGCSRGGMEDRGRSDRIDERPNVRFGGSPAPSYPCTSAVKPSAERLRRMTPIAAREESTRVAEPAPRDSASIASAPDPANRSSDVQARDIAEDRKQRLSDPVAGRTRGRASRARLAWPRDACRRSPSTGHALIGAAASAPYTAVSASASSACSGSDSSGSAVAIRSA